MATSAESASAAAYVSAGTSPGFDAHKLFNTWLFEREPSINTLFDHKQLGCRASGHRGVRRPILLHVGSGRQGDAEPGPETWGEPAVQTAAFVFHGRLDLQHVTEKLKQRPMDRLRAMAIRLQGKVEKGLKAAVTDAEILQLIINHPTTAVAHDLPPCKNNARKNNAKFYMLMSAWQLMAAWGVPFERRREHGLAEMKDGAVLSPNRRTPADLQDARSGAMRGRWPTCSVYTFRENTVIMNVDVDAVYLMTDEERSANKQAMAATEASERVRARFECPRDGCLAQLRDAILEAWAQCPETQRACADPVVGVHSSSGYKPSYRLFVVGPVFRTSGDVGHFVDRHLMPVVSKLEWFREGIIDTGNYSPSGIDRALGMAKAETGKMRVMSPEPMRDISPVAYALYSACPNRYVAICASLIYSASHVAEGCSPIQLVRKNAKSDIKKRTRQMDGGRDAGGPAYKKVDTDNNYRACSPAAAQLADKIVGSTLRRLGYRSEWTSDPSKTELVRAFGEDTWTQVQVHPNYEANEQTNFCVHREVCVNPIRQQRELNPAARKHSPADRSGKITFVIDLAKRTLGQYCHSCRVQSGLSFPDHMAQGYVARLAESEELDVLAASVLDPGRATPTVSGHSAPEEGEGNGGNEDESKRRAWAADDNLPPAGWATGFGLKGLRNKVK